MGASFRRFRLATLAAALALAAPAVAQSEPAAPPSEPDLHGERIGYFALPVLIALALFIAIAAGGTDEDTPTSP